MVDENKLPRIQSPDQNNPHGPLGAHSVAQDQKRPKDTITPQDAQEILLHCYKLGRSDSFPEFLLRQIEDPVQPRDQNNRRKLHPLINLVMVFGALGAGTFLLFTFWH